jgi:hypothetical protein
MPREGAIIFGDLVGKLDVLRIECDKCGRRGRYRLDRLIWRYGIDAKLFEWSDEVTADCPRKQAKNLYQSVRCALSGLAEGVVGRLSTPEFRPLQLGAFDDRCSYRG